MPETSGIRQMMPRDAVLLVCHLALLASVTDLAATRIRRKRCCALDAERLGYAGVGSIAYKSPLAGISFLA
jgi:hypothetical protein